MAADPTPPRFIIEINTTGFGIINGRWYQWRYHWNKKKYWWRWRGHPRLLPRGDPSFFLFFTWRRQYSRLLFSNFLVGSLALTQALSFHTHYKSGVIHVVEYELRSVAFFFWFPQLSNILLSWVRNWLLPTVLSLENNVVVCPLFTPHLTYSLEGERDFLGYFLIQQDVVRSGLLILD